MLVTDSVLKLYDPFDASQNTGTQKFRDGGREAERYVEDNYMFPSRKFISAWSH